MEDEEENPHGFLSASLINNYKMTQGERKKFMIDANIEKEKYKQNRKEKVGYCFFLA